MFTKTFTLTALMALTFSLGLRAEVVSEFDSEKNCTWSKRLNKVRNSQGDLVFERDLTPGEEIVSKRNLYGFGLTDLEVDFDNREVSFHVEQKIILGFNRNLTKSKVTLPESHPRFQEIINEINIDIALFDGVCIAKNGEFIDSFKTRP